MLHLRTFVRGASFALSGFLSITGALRFIHNALVVTRCVAPVGDGPFGLIIGPIFLVIGGAWFVRLRTTRNALK